MEADVKREWAFIPHTSCGCREHHGTSVLLVTKNKDTATLSAEQGIEMQSLPPRVPS